MTHFTKTVRPAALLALVCLMYLGLFMRGGDSSAAFGDVPCYQMDTTYDPPTYCCATLGITSVTNCLACGEAPNEWNCCNLVLPADDESGNGQNDKYLMRREVASGGHSPAVFTKLSPIPECWYYKLLPDPCGRPSEPCRREKILRKAKCNDTWQKNYDDLCP